MGTGPATWGMVGWQGCARSRLGYGEAPPPSPPVSSMKTCAAAIGTDHCIRAQAASSYLGVRAPTAFGTLHTMSNAQTAYRKPMRPNVQYARRTCAQRRHVHTTHTDGGILVSSAHTLGAAPPGSKGAPRDCAGNTHVRPHAAAPVCYTHLGERRKEHGYGERASCTQQRRR
jgi:hypothetical protein